MGIDAEDVKILARKGLIFIVDSCRQCVMNHPWVTCVVLFFFFLRVFLPSVFYILFYSSPLVIAAFVFLDGRYGFKGFNKGNYVETNVAFTRVPQVETNRAGRSIGSIVNDEIKGSRMDESDAKSNGEKNEMPLRIREGKNAKRASIDPLSSEPYDRVSSSESLKLMSEFSKSDDEDEDEDEPHEETIKAVQWTEDDERNLMQLGTSEIERNRSLELIEKKMATKLLSMQARRSPLHMDSYDNEGQVPRRDVEGAEIQPGSAPSMMLPTMFPFDIPYASTQEKPFVTGGSYQVETFSSQKKGCNLNGHDSFVPGAAYVRDLDDDQPRGTDYPSDKTDKMEANVVDTKEEESVEAKGEGQDSMVTEELRQASPNEAETEASSSTSSDEGEDIGNIDTNEAFGNSVRKQLTCLIARNKIGLPMVPQYDSSPITIHPITKMEERSFYTSKPFHTPTCSIASDMLVEVSEAGSPTFNVEPNSPTDRESLVYDGDVDKEINSDDEELWGESPHPVRLEELGSRVRVSNTGKMGKSPLEIPGKSESISDKAAHDVSSSSYAAPALLKENIGESTEDQDQHLIMDGNGSRSPVPSSSEHLSDPLQGKTAEFIDNYVPSDVTSCTSEEQSVHKYGQNTELMNDLTQDNHAAVQREQQNLEQPAKPTSSSDSSVMGISTMDDTTSTSSDVNMHSDDHHPKEVVMNHHELLNDQKEESHAPETVTLDEVSLINTEASTDMDSQHVNEAPMMNKPSNDQHQENEAFLGGDEHLNGQSKPPSSPRSNVEATAELQTSLKQLERGADDTSYRVNDSTAASSGAEEENVNLVDRTDDLAVETRLEVNLPENAEEDKITSSNESTDINERLNGEDIITTERYDEPPTEHVGTSPEALRSIEAPAGNSSKLAKE
ncbi:hypothetical protein Droror1_Dr00003241 [Drosera rotundifolia]